MPEHIILIVLLYVQQLKQKRQLIARTPILRGILAIKVYKYSEQVSLSGMVVIAYKRY